MRKKVFEKVTDENATVLWATFCDARAMAEELFKKPRYRDTSIFFKDCFISTCIATWLSIMLKWDDLPSEYRERLSEELEENYSHGYHSLYICRYVFFRSLCEVTIGVPSPANAKASAWISPVETEISRNSF